MLLDKSIIWNEHIEHGHAHWLGGAWIHWRWVKEHARGDGWTMLRVQGKAIGQIKGCYRMVLGGIWKGNIQHSHAH